MRPPTTDLDHFTVTTRAYTGKLVVRREGETLAHQKDQSHRMC